MEPAPLTQRPTPESTSSRPREHVPPVRSEILSAGEIDPQVAAAYVEWLCAHAERNP